MGENFNKFQDIHVIGIDFGRLFTKSVTPATKDIFRSTVSKGDFTSLAFTNGEEQEQPTFFKYEGHGFLVGGNVSDDTVPPLSKTAAKVIPLSLAAILRAFHTQIVKNEGGTIEVTASVAMPLSEAASSSETVKKMLIGEYSLEYKEFPVRVKIEQVIVVPEGVATFFDRLYFSEQIDKDLLSQSILVADIGSRTTDIAFIRPGAVLDWDKSISIPKGVWDALEVLLKKLSKKVGILTASETARLRKAATENKTKIFLKGEEIDFEEEIVQAKKQIAEMLFEDIQTIVRETSPDLILLSGGGVYFFEREVKPFLREGVEIVGDPLFSCARGLLVALKTLD